MTAAQFRDTLRAFAAPFAVLALAAAAPARADTIQFLGSRKPQPNVIVVDEKIDVVEYTLKGVTQRQTVNSAEVADVVYEDPGADFTTAKAALDAARDPDAAKAAAARFRALYPGIKKKGLAAKALLNAAEGHARAGDRTAAIEIYDKLVADLPQSRYVPVATLEKGKALLAAGDSKLARAALTRLKEFGGRWQLESDLWLQVEDEAADPAAAIDNYRRIVQASKSKYRTVADAAEIRLGRALLKTGRFDEAAGCFRGILDHRTTSARDVQAGAWNGYGAALSSKDGASEGDVKTALFAHLRVVTQFDDVIDEQPEALYRAAKCFQRVSVQDNVARAKVLLARCQREYAGSEWAALAAQG